MGLCGRKLQESCSAVERVSNPSSFRWHNVGKDTPNRKNISMGHLPWLYLACLPWVINLGVISSSFDYIETRPWIKGGSGETLLFSTAI